ncbi:T4SS efffector SepA family protein [Mesorhizobium sp. NZP2298]|uniref:T4SS efffector SepA family protein n=1 Tax=Mesorhizobium sp. NZP2298 TaxID=2483403 RepID=UPI001551F250|nr:hypothetical protein [Mesorhizobium sp. NZP2298]QKC97160.1 hypothetical protein EB231_22605 [Mesorhizobium sp. NZP2298]
MAPSVELSPETFKRLQAHATPLVDTVETVIGRMIDAFEATALLPAEVSKGQSVRSFNPNTPPDLTHTNILGVTFNGCKLGRGKDNWNGVVDAAVRAAAATARSHDELRRLIVVNYVEGTKQDEGYRPLADAGISVQAQDANGAWRAACHIARQLGCDLSIKFAWREKEGAAYPGIAGQMIVDANK